MTDTSAIISVPKEVRDFAVQYAISRNMPKKTINRYTSGEADSDPLIQGFALLYTSAKAASASEIALLNNALELAKQDMNALKNDAANLKDGYNTMLRVLNKIQNRLKGSFWNKLSDIKKILAEIHIL